MQDIQINKKQRKYQHTIEKQTSLKCTTCVTKHLGICNSGLVNGLSEEVIYDNFSKYGTLEQIYMLPGKSCCLVSFENESFAVEAFKKINGILKIAQYNKPIYLSFIEKIPESFIKENSSLTSDLPNGLFILENFLSENEEQMFLNLNNFELSDNSIMKNRQVKHYGYEFKYDTNNVDPNSPLNDKIPKECNILWDRLRKNHENITFLEPDQLTVNYYKPGHGIPPHVDTHSAFEDPILILSLGSPVVMEFKNDEEKRLSVLLPQRSFTIMSGESRYAWTHGITPRKLDIIRTKTGLSVNNRGTRVSFTFRKIRTRECDCAYPNKCDSQVKLKNNSNREEMENLEKVSQRLEETHVYEVYERIAQHFSETRSKPWPNVLNFVKSFGVGSILVDVGCGNGKYMDCGQNIFQIGLDTSESLLKVCKERNFEVMVGNCLKIPLRDNTADGAISIAVLHHLSTEERRSRALKEIVRILKPGGKALIYVWAVEQNRNNEKSAYLKQDRKNRKQESILQTEQEDQKYTLTDNLELPIHNNRTQFKHQDVLVPWKLKKKCDSATSETFLRFYHVFQEGELDNLCKLDASVDIEGSYYDQGNWCVIVQKK